jgi:type II secretory pathway pseudopilin PulG
MDQIKTKTTAQDFFIYLGVLIGLYATAISLINLLFSLINKWLPDTNNFYFESFSSVARISIAVLIIFFPAFLYLSRISTKAVVLTPEKKEMWVRRWFSYLTLFIAGLTIAIDSATLIYRFIGGEDLTLRFVLKVIVVLVIALVIFRFYLSELRRDFTLPTPYRKYYHYIAWIIVVAAIIFGIVAIGSPTTQRNIRFDQQRVNDLSSIQNAVTDYYRANNKLPADLLTLTQGTTYYLSSVVDPVTKINYDYKILAANKYNICAVFSSDSNETSNNDVSYPATDMWKHGVGQTCFERTPW